MVATPGGILATLSLANYKSQNERTDAMARQDKSKGVK